MKCKALNQSGMRAAIGCGIVKTLFAVVVALQLVACGGGGGSSAAGSGTVAAAGGAGSTAGDGTTGTGGTTSSSGGSQTSTDSTAGAGTSGTGGTTSSSGGSQTSTSATGSLMLSWAAPVARADGTPLSLADIDGFRIYYGNAAGNYTHSVNVTDATTQQVILKNLASGTYYIVMTTYDVDGRESGYSTAIKKTVS